MKTLTAHGVDFQATKIVKRTDSIICYDERGNIIFEFRGISDFAGYSCDSDYDVELDLEKVIANEYFLALTGKVSQELTKEAQIFFEKKLWTKEQIGDIVKTSKLTEADYKNITGSDFKV